MHSVQIPGGPDIGNLSSHKTGYPGHSRELPRIAARPENGRINNRYHLPPDDVCELAKEILKKKVGLSFVTGGTSMHPFIKHGDTVIIQPAVSLKIGDVVLARNQQRLILHRIIRITGDGVITRGDACLCDDGFTPLEEIFGTAVKSSGLGFHLKFPFNKLIARGFFHPSRLSRHRFIFLLAKRLSYHLGRGNMKRTW